MWRAFCTACRNDTPSFFRESSKQLRRRINWRCLQSFALLGVWVKGSPVPHVGFEPTKLGLMEHDPHDSNINAHVFLLLMSLIYHPSQTQGVQLRGQVSFAVCWWKISVANSDLTWIFISLASLSSCPNVANFVTLSQLFSAFCFYTGPVHEPRPKNTWFQPVFPYRFGNLHVFTELTQYRFPETEHQLRPMSQKNEILESCHGQFIGLSLLSHGCNYPTPARFSWE